MRSRREEKKCRDDCLKKKSCLCSGERGDHQLTRLSRRRRSSQPDYHEQVAPLNPYKELSTNQKELSVPTAAALFIKPQSANLSANAVA